jgi:predicted O-methyltransferase YrrM
MKCPNCQSTKIRKHGFYRDKQRYQCKDCARQFVEYHTSNLQQTSTGVEDEIERYIQSISTPPDELVRDLQRATAEYPLAQMQPTLAQVQSIALLLRSISATHVLELGIFSGYSTLALALALPPHGRLMSCGVSGKHLDVARTYWERGGVTDRIDFQMGSGIELLDRLLAESPLASFDAIVIAGLKYQYPLYYERSIELLRSHGLLITTDVLWQGRVLKPDTYHDEYTQGIALFNRELVADPRFNVSVVPMGDGLSIALKL